MKNTFEILTKKYSYKVNEMCIKLFEEVAPLYKEEANIDQFNQIILSQLYTQLYKTGESILTLTSQGNAFEAEVLVRILSEGSIKYIFMIHDDIQSKSENINEYYNVFPETQKIDEHEKAVEAMEIFKGLGYSRHPYDVSILTDEELAGLKEKYSRNYINKLNKKWSYKNLLKKLIETDKVYSVLATTYYSYSLSSHFIHYDGEALYMRSEATRLQAVKEDYNLDLAHVLRIISNVLAMMLLRTGEYIEKYSISSKKAKETIDEAIKLQSEIDGIVDKITENNY